MRRRKGYTSQSEVLRRVQDDTAGKSLWVDEIGPQVGTAIRRCGVPNAQPSMVMEQGLHFTLMKSYTAANSL